MIGLVDRFLDRITMYRLVLWYLMVLLVAAALLGALHVIALDPIALILSAALVLAGGWIANRTFAWIFGAIPNIESVYISGLIILLIMDPAPLGDLAAAAAIVLASLWAVSSKFILAVRRRHIFNPAALGVALPGLLLGYPATWWVSGELWLMPIVVAGGLLVVRKLRRFDLVIAFCAANLAATVLTGSIGDAGSSLQLAVLHSPIFFLACVMLTEPLTAPQGRLWRILYGILVGVLASPNTVIGGYYFTPELALLAGNVFTLLVSPKGRVVLTLERIEQAGSGIFDFVFRPDRRVAFAAGQYLEWTLPVDKPDARGNRRYFTIASAPNEGDIRLGVKFVENGSAFKRGLAKLVPGDQIVASQLAGSFTLPRNKAKKLAFVAGGVGVTPFRSMLTELLHHGERRDIEIVYGSNRIDEFAYVDVLARARRELGVATHYVVRDSTGAPPEMLVGLINAELLRQTISDWDERLFYVSGPQPMVAATREALLALGVPQRRIRTDFFPGLA